MLYVLILFVVVNVNVSVKHWYGIPQVTLQTEANLGYAIHTTFNCYNSALMV